MIAASCKVLSSPRFFVVVTPRFPKRYSNWLKLLVMQNWKRFLFSNFWILLLASWFVGRYFYFLPKYEAGATAPDFIISPQDTTLRLSGLKGNYVLVQFWGSWCGPCRRENPMLTSIYKKYQQAKFKDATAFQIVGVAIEKDSIRWQTALQRDGLGWQYQVLDKTSSFKFFNGAIASQYGVKRLPSSFLLNAQGMIIMNDLTPEKLDEFLKNHLHES